MTVNLASEEPRPNDALGHFAAVATILVLGAAKGLRRKVRLAARRDSLNVLSESG
jgi:hypothetical protein